MCEYEIQFSADLGSVVTEVGDMVNHVNAHLSSDGYLEKLIVRIPFPTITIKSNHELSEGELSTMKNILLGEYCKAFPKYDIRAESIRRKSGNVQQSAAQ